MGELTSTLRRVYDLLLATYGPQHWWPGETSFEVMIGAILTQSTSWTNVEKAIANLKRAGALSPQAIRNMPMSALAELIHPSGYYNAKASKLKALVEWLGKANDDLDKAFDKDTTVLRQELLTIYGIGPETADSILLYAANRPVFVIDAYTRRVLRRLGLVSGVEGYNSLQLLCTDNLPADEIVYNEYHALLVHLGKETCRSTPRCDLCCLEGLCPKKQ